MRPLGFFVVFFLTSISTLAERITVLLDGEWQIEDSVDADAVPRNWTHHVPVPGLANLAQPAFVDVDRFDGKEVLWNRIRRKVIPASTSLEGQGISRQSRNYFWYAKSFRVPASKQVALLRIGKAQFGTAVWLNGKKLGEYAGCFSASYFDLTQAMDWSGENRLIVRIGAHPAVLPESYPAGSDFEKNLWTPGIYDSVSVLLMDNPVIETIQAAPAITPPQITVQTKLKNYGAAPATTTLRHQVKAWKGGQRAGQSMPQKISLKPGEEKTLTETIPIPGARLWSPEDPFLYVLDSSTGGDTVSTRFGVREFRFDTPTKRAYLNGKVYFLRGSNITLHRFFEDPDAGSLTWNETWVRKLLSEIPKKMNWNMFRFCIGPVPDKWLDIADETGLLIQNEFFIWTGRASGNYKRQWDADELIRQYGDWMRDNWNHASVVIWDANNESYDPVFGEKVIPAVRDLDLSHRPWENSYNPPAGPDDPVEDHPYLFSSGRTGNPFQVTSLENMSGSGRNTVTPSGHAMVLNEYGWLWLLRDGTPTVLTERVYEHLLGKTATGQERLALNGYLLGGLTEFWRAHRNYAGVLHFVYLTSCYEGAYTCDHFSDVKSLTMDPTFADYAGEAFKPLGVYLNFWQPNLKTGVERRFTVMMVNDSNEPARGNLVLTLDNEGGEAVARVERKFSIQPLGQETLLLDLKIPDVAGSFLLKAAAHAVNGSGPTLSRRRVSLQRE
ncbi:MAG: hypothetical protein HUU41_14205 [Bryobacteraceae bacterium]|nr:hypothetical protein [Bryobacterales bacterium]NUN02263.1 hypothetical protein [Bryobacteraceae bacterium]